MHRPLPLLLILLLASSASATPRRFRLAEGSRVTFQAASTLHGFHGGTESVSGEVLFDAEDPRNSSGKVVIQADQLRTGDRKRDRGMRDQALEVKEHPSITMSMERFVPAREQTQAGVLTGSIHGKLDLHGVSLPLVVPAEVTEASDGSLAVSGKVGIDMTRWDIAPPVTKIFLVSLRVLPNVSVAFDLKFEPREDRALQARLQKLEALKARLGQ